MEIGILGPLEVRAGGRVIPITGSRLRALLARLAVDAPAPVSTAELVNAVWPAGPPADPLNAVQSLISRVRRALGEPGAIQQATESPAGACCGRRRRHNGDRGGEVR